MSLSQVNANANTQTNINRNINTHKCKYKYKYNYWYKPNHKIAERHDWRNVLPSSYWRRWGEVKLRPKVSTFSNISAPIFYFQYFYSKSWLTNIFNNPQSCLRVPRVCGQLSPSCEDVVQDAQDHQGKSFHSPINLSMNPSIYRNIIMAIKTTILTTIELTKESSFWSGGSFPREVPEHHGQCQRCHGAFKCKWSYTLSILHFASNF